MPNRRVPILTYHALDNSHSVVSISPSIFERQMRWLYEHDYRVIALSSLARQVRSGGPLPQRTVAVTFDDGFSTVHTVAFPILARYRFPATVFLVTSHCGGRNDWPGQPAAVPRQPLLTWAQVREMDSHGVEFGAHTLSHPWLDRLAPEQMEREIVDSRKVIEDYLGHQVALFAYPYGRWNPAIRGVVGRAFAAACTARLGAVGPGTDPLALSRVDACYVTPRLVFEGVSNPLFSIYLDVRRILRTVSRQPWR